MGFFSKIKASLSKTRDHLTKKIETVILGYADINDDLLDEIEEIMIMADVGVKSTEFLMQEIRQGIKSKDIKEPGDLKPFLAKTISQLLSSKGNASNIKIATQGPTVFLVIGVNGAGKTTTIGKLSAFYKKEGKSVMLAAGDTFRAAAIEQLEVWSKRTEAKFLSQDEGADPAAVAFDAVKAAKARNIDILIIDTAGRLQTKANLMEELKKINRVLQREIPDAPHEVFLVIDATTGQNALSQAKEFSKVAKITGLILTKLDGTAKGGVVIGIHHEMGIPVKWIGIGEKVDDLEPFNAEEFSKALFKNDEVSIEDKN